MKEGSICILANIALTCGIFNIFHYLTRQITNKGGKAHENGKDLENVPEVTI